MDVNADWLVKLVAMKLIASTSQEKRCNVPYAKNGSRKIHHTVQVNANYGHTSESLAPLLVMLNLDRKGIYGSHLTFTKLYARFPIQEASWLGCRYDIAMALPRPSCEEKCIKN